MNTQTQQPNFTEMVLENLLNQNSILSRDLAIVKAELDMAKLEIKRLKGSQQTEGN